jgi:spore maturation protein CgeB
MEKLSQLRKKALICAERPMGPPMLPKQAERLLRWRKLRPLLQRLPVWRCAWEYPRTDQARSWVVNRSKVHFGISRVRGSWEEGVRALVPNYPFDEHGLFYQCKGRLFHAIGGGALALNDYFPELEEMFDIGTEIVTYQFGNLEEVEDKLKYYLAHDAERERIARAGYERGRKQHTFVARIQQMFDTLRRDSQRRMASGM